MSEVFKRLKSHNPLFFIIAGFDSYLDLKKKTLEIDQEIFIVSGLCFQNEWQKVDTRLFKGTLQGST